MDFEYLARIIGELSNIEIKYLQSNIAFLKNLQLVVNALKIELMETKSKISIITICRRYVELFVSHLIVELGLDKSITNNVNSTFHENEKILKDLFTNKSIDGTFLTNIEYIRKIGNIASHNHSNLSTNCYSSYACLNSILDILDCLFQPNFIVNLKTNTGSAAQLTTQSTNNIKTCDVKSGDWFCKKCSEHNFKKRLYCFKCKKMRNDWWDPYNQ